MIITEEILSYVSGAKNLNVWVDAFNEVLPENGIDSKLRVAAFLAQCSHESAGFTVLKENLNYSAAGLKATFPKYFPTQVLADEYARIPSKIASRVYANRMGNGDEESQDGWRYCGRGIIMITGKSGYGIISKAIFNDLRLLDNPDLLIIPEYAIKSACIFWKNNNLNKCADNQDITLMTKKINGGKNGLLERQENYERILSILS